MSSRIYNQNRDAWDWEVLLAYFRAMGPREYTYEELDRLVGYSTAKSRAAIGRARKELESTEGWTMTPHKGGFTLARNESPLLDAG